LLFSSYVFVFAFLPIVTLLYFASARLFARSFQHGILVIASLIFYGWFNPYYLPIIIFSIAFNFQISRMMRPSYRQSTRKIFFILGVIGNVAMLGYFKYYDFFVENINVLFATDFAMKKLVLPLGISFFTFQQLSFLISSYKHNATVKHFIDYSLFVCFFPQLIAGPIVTYDEMMPQFAQDGNRKFNADNFAAGLFLFSLGMFKKLVVADTVAIVADSGFDKLVTMSFFQAWFTSLSYCLQIYFDFSGYCDMAIGLGKMFNIDLPVNFNSPYKSLGIREFWKRWHITLGRALTTFVYIPLGGSKNGKVRLYLSLFITFLVSGLWHGAAWTFVFWGVLHGLFIVSERIFDNYWSKLNTSFRCLTTFLLVNFLWIFFRATSWHNAVEVLKSHFNLNFEFTLKTFMPLAYDSKAELMIIFPIFLVAIIIVFTARNSICYFQEFKPSSANAILTVVMIVISIVFMSRVSPFIYFNF